MALENLLKEVTEAYVQWCKESSVSLTKKDIAFFIDVVRDNLKKLYQKRLPGTLKMDGTESGRTEEIEFLVEGTKGIVNAWGNTYRVPLEELEGLETEKIKYAEDEMVPVWVRGITITPENIPWVEDVYERFFQE